jgi:hypothetical protein
MHLTAERSDVPLRGPSPQISDTMQEIPLSSQGNSLSFLSAT